MLIPYINNLFIEIAHKREDLFHFGGFNTILLYNFHLGTYLYLSKTTVGFDMNMNGLMIARYYEGADSEEVEYCWHF